MGLFDYTLYNVIKRNAALYGESVALILGDRQITYSQFLETVDKLACGLSEAGAVEGDRVCVLAQNSLEYVYLYGACAKIGAIVLTVNWRLKPEEIEYVISDCTPKLLFAESGLQALVDPLIDKCEFLEKCYSMGAAEGRFSSFSELVDHDRTGPDFDVAWEGDYVIIHTAAVAGRPRGAVLSHRGLILACLQLGQGWQLTTKDCNLGLLPLFHVAALEFFVAVLVAGGTNIIVPRFDPAECLRLIEKHKVTVFGEFPPILSSLLDTNEEMKCDLSSLKAAGGLEAPDTVKRFQETTNATFWSGYGQSETHGLVTLAPYMERAGSAGLPGVLTELAIVDEHGNFVDTGQSGEIVTRGPIVFNGYWNLEKDTEYTFRDGWHHTGDMGRLDEDGYLWFAGRMPEKELIKPGGENVYPAEVEKAIVEHAAVEEASVIGVPDEQWGEAIKAVCVLKAGESVTEAELTEFVASRIARFKKPKHVVFVSELPKKADGSIDREKVKADHGAP